MEEEKKYELFISYVEADKAWVEGYLLDALREAKINLIIESAFDLGVPRILEFERAIQQSKATLLVISEAYLADGLTRFTDIMAQNYGAEVGTWSVFTLILKPELQLPPRLQMLQGLKATNPQEWEAAIERLCQDLKRPLPDPSPKPTCPYLGMIPFKEENKKHFFGRDGEIEELLIKLSSNSFLTVIGASGSGKSSLVFAGLIPQLKQSGLFGAGQWCVRSLCPGISPLANLQKVLGGNIAALEVTIEQLLSTQPDAQRLLLVVDQFEELFTQAETEATTFQETLLRLADINNVYLILTVRADFYPDLMGSLLWKKIRSRLFNVLPLGEKGLRQAIVKPAERLEVYVDPVLVERLIVDARGEPGVLPLIQQTLKQLWDKLERRFLPLRAYDNLLVLSRSVYGGTETKPSTGLQRAIANSANDALADLEEAQQAIACRIFLRLIQFGEGRPDTRRQQSEADLRSDEEDAELFDATLEHLASGKCRLLIFSGEKEEQNRKVDLAHEALIFGWPTFQEWIAQLRKAEKTRRRLQEKAREWIRLDKKGGLLDEAELPEAQNWLSSNEAKVLGYDKSLQDFVIASREKIEAIKQQQQEQQERELKLVKENLEAEKHAKQLVKENLEAEKLAKQLIKNNLKAEKLAKRKAQILNRVLAISSVILSVLFVFAGFQWKNAQIGQIRALSESSKAKFVANRDSLDPLLDALQAGKRLKSLTWLLWGKQKIELKADVMTALTESAFWVKEKNRLEGHSGWVSSLSFSSDGETIATAGEDKTIKLWQRDGKHEHIDKLEGHEKEVMSVDFHPKKNILVSGSFDGTVRLWKKQGDKWEKDNTHQISFSNDTNKKTQVRAVSFSPDEKFFAAAGDDGTVKLWKLNGELIAVMAGKEGHQDKALSLSFNRDSKTLATASSDKTIKLWRWQDGEGIVIDTKKHQDKVTSVSFNPIDNNIVASGSLDGTITLWQYDGNQITRIKTFEAHSDGVRSIGFSPDGQILASASQDNTVKLWQPDSKETKTINFDVDRNTIEPAEPINTVKLWQNITLLTTFNGHSNYITSVDFSRDGKILGSASNDNTAKLWKLENRGLTVLNNDTEIESVSFGRNNQILAAANRGNTVNFWQLNGLSGSLATRLILAGKDNKIELNNINFDSDISLLALASSYGNDGEEGLINLWKLDEDGIPQSVIPISQKGDKEFMDISFSSDKQTIATANRSGKVQFWKFDDTSKTEMTHREFKQHEGIAYGVRFNTDATVFASSGNDGIINLYDPDGTPIDSLNEPKKDAYAFYEASFSPDGKMLAGASKDGSVKLWKVDRGSIKFDRELRLDGSPITAVKFNPKEPYLASANDRGEIFLWRLDGTFITKLTGHEKYILSLSFSEDGKFLASGSDDKNTIVWNLDNLSLEHLMKLGCDWAQDYLKTNSSLEPDTNSLCHNVSHS